MPTVSGRNPLSCGKAMAKQPAVVRTLPTHSRKFMDASRVLRTALAALCISVFSAVSFAQAQKDFKPQVGQQGKDVVWVPTSQALVDKMLDMAKVTPNDFVIDLGSGDGRTVITAATRRARA